MDKLKTKVLNLLPVEGVEEKVLVKGASSSFVIKVVGAGLAFGVNILLARLLGVKDYGAYIYIYTWVFILSLPIRLGLDSGLVRFIPEYKSAQKWSELKGILSFAYKSVFLVGVIIAVIIIGAVIIFDDLVGSYDQNLVIVGAVILPVLGLLFLTVGSLKGFKNVIGALVPNMIIKQLLIAFGTLVIYLFYQKVTAENAMIATLFSIGIALLIGLYFLKMN